MMINKTEVRVRYADTDQMKFVYNGKYFEYFEVGRSEMMREVGLTYDEIEKQGYHMPVMEAKIEFKNAAFYDEVLIIESSVKELPKLKVHIDHKIYSKERNVLIVEGYIELAFMRADTRKLTRPPLFFLDTIRKFYD
ncbi:MAG TPA: thioesterase family protein [Ignavibacteriaceae bacterium]|nr:thioesterase family protein [Ignavibacteriaceae bacterium]